MVERIMEDVFLDASRRFQCDGDVLTLVDYGRRIRLHLCRKQTLFGDIPVDHWWMDWRSVYGDRDCRDSNHQPLINLYWGMCKREFTVTEEPVQESYLLAHLLPYARSKGSRRVLLDSVPIRKRAMQADKVSVAAALDHLLQRSRDQEMDIVEFRDSTANAIGPPAYDEEVRETYDRLAEDLLGRGRKVLESEGDRGVDVTVDLWQEWMRSIGRRSGHVLEKQVLDILSYECRAAVHRCYSAVWDQLIFLLAEKYDLSDEEVVFHRFWHLDQLMPSDQPDEAHFHLFHGHIFGLHPAGAEFMLTTTGRELMGEWLSDPHPLSAPYRRLLHGLSVAVHNYAIRNDVYAELRKKQPKYRGGQDLVTLEEQNAEKRSGRRRAHKRQSDAR